MEGHRDNETELAMASAKLPQEFLEAAGVDWDEGVFVMRNSAMSCSRPAQSSRTHDGTPVSIRTRSGLRARAMRRAGA